VLQLAGDDRVKRAVTLYGRVGVFYDLERATNLIPAAIWTSIGTVQLTNPRQVLTLPPEPGTTFYRALERSE